VTLEEVCRGASRSSNASSLEKDIRREEE